MRNAGQEHPMILEVLEFPDPGLRNVAEPIEEEEVTEKTRELAHDMLETMYHQPGIDAHVIVEARTLDCEQVEFDSVELEAFCLQHEIDHLDGVLFIDRISRLKRDLYVHRRKKQLRRDREVAGHST